MAADASESLDVAVVGAGPFGLSAAAWFQDLKTRVYGPSMHTWRALMPAGMQLRSEWDETSLSAPAGGTLDDWVAAVGESKQDPMQLEYFVSYGDWFRDQLVNDYDDADVTSVELQGDGYVVRTGRRDAAFARSVVIAIGVTPFHHAPEVFAPFLGSGVRFATAFRDFASLAGRRVVVVGGGQGGLESAGLAAQAGADVELIARSGVHWFSDREPYHPRGPIHERLYRLAYPAVGLGPPGLNRLVAHPDVYAALPEPIKQRVGRFAMRPGGSPWIRKLVEGKVQITDGVSVRAVDRVDGGLRITGDDGSTRTVDEVILSTGFRFDLDRMTFLSPERRERVAVRGAWPVLDRFFEASVPGLFFIGFAAEGRFGPAIRFVRGTDFTMPRLSAGVRQRLSSERTP
jgi:hypothetical protein